MEWDPTNNDIVVFKVTAKTLGYFGIGFNDKNHMKNADIIIGWIDDQTGSVNLLVRKFFKSNFFNISLDLHLLTCKCLNCAGESKTLFCHFFQQVLTNSKFFVRNQKFLSFPKKLLNSHLCLIYK